MRAETWYIVSQQLLIIKITNTNNQLKHFNTHTLRKTATYKMSIKTHHYRTSQKRSKCSWKKKQRLKSLKSLKINTIIFLNAKQAAIDNTGPSKYCIKSKYYIIIRIFMVMHACMYIRSSTTGYTHYPVICRKCYYGLHQSCCEHYAHVTDTKVPSLRAP